MRQARHEPQREPLNARRIALAAYLAISVPIHTMVAIAIPLAVALESSNRLSFVLVVPLMMNAVGLGIVSADIVRASRGIRRISKTRRRQLELFLGFVSLFLFLPAMPTFPFGLLVFPGPGFAAAMWLDRTKNI